MSEYLSKSHSPPSPARSLCARQAARARACPIIRPNRSKTWQCRDRVHLDLYAWRLSQAGGLTPFLRPTAAPVMPSGASPASPAECMPTIPEAFQ